MGVARWLWVTVGLLFVIITQADVSAPEWSCFSGGGVGDCDATVPALDMTGVGCIIMLTGGIPVFPIGSHGEWLEG